MPKGAIASLRILTLRPSPRCVVQHAGRHVTGQQSPPPDASRFEWEDDGTDLHVTITQQLGRLFDGVDFMAMSSDGVELGLLKSAQAEVTARRVAEPGRSQRLAPSLHNAIAASVTS